MKQTLSDWAKDHWFGMVSLVLTAVGFASSYGVIGNKIETLTTRADKQSLKIDAQQAIDAERRLTALEKRTDDVEKITVVVQMNGEQIKTLADAMKSDHDVLIRIVAAMDAKK